MWEDRKHYESKLDAQMAQWKADIDVMRAKAKRMHVDALVEHDKGLDALQVKHDEVGIHLTQLKASTDEAWGGVKEGTEKVWTDLKALFHSVGTA